MTVLITTNKNIADEIEKKFNSEVFMMNRKNFYLISINHSIGYSDVCINYENAKDLFWLGLFIN